MVRSERKAMKVPTAIRASDAQNGMVKKDKTTTIAKM